MNLSSIHQSLSKSDFHLSNYQSNFGDPSNIDTSKTKTWYKMTNPLIAMIGILEYDNDVLPNLDCVANDYKNVQHAFYVVRGYSYVYFNKQNQLIHKKSDKMNESRTVISRNDIKLRWSENEILNYNDQVHLIVENRKYNYDGLIYFISCHGDIDGVIYDSSGSKIPLIVIFEKFNNQNCVQLRNKPKIYFVEACRGNRRTKRIANSMFQDQDKNDNIYNTSTNSSSKQIANIQNDIDKHKVHELEHKETSSEPNLQVIPSITTVAHTPSPPPPVDNHNHNDHFSQTIGIFGNLTMIDENETDDKDEFKDGSFQMNNNNHNMNNTHNNNNLNGSGVFSKYNYNREIYANTEGYAVVEPGKNGAYMTRSITQAIENDDIFQKDLNKILHHTRKIMLKLMGTSVECAAQVIQDNNNIPKNVFFA